MNENRKLVDKCEVLVEMIISLSGIYNSCLDNKDKKNLIETTIGAAIWYLPQGKEYWTGCISYEAIKLLLKEGKLSKLTKEHAYPRKIAGRELLLYDWNDVKSPSEKLLLLYQEKYGKFNYVTRGENKRLVKFQKEGEFISTKKAYKKAEIELIKITETDLKDIKEKNEKVVEKILNQFN